MTTSILYCDVSYLVAGFLHLLFSVIFSFSTLYVLFIYFFFLSHYYYSLRPSFVVITLSTTTVTSVARVTTAVTIPIFTAPIFKNYNDYYLLKLILHIHTSQR